MVFLSCDQSKTLWWEGLFTDFFSPQKGIFTQSPISLSLCKIQWAKDQSKRHVSCIVGMGRVNVLLLCYCVVLPLGEE